MFFILSVETKAQETVSAGGDYIESPLASVEFAIGQIDFQYTAGSQGSISEGLLQNYDVLTSIKPSFLPDLNIEIFPNPTSDFLNVHIKSLSISDGGYEVYITNAVGVVLEKSEIEAGRKTVFKISEYPTGIYFVQLKQGSRYSQFYKVIKQ
ncbi:T9SS type A sorting domain-containing protein [Membranihabitans marinus]|uniref:T9SS type A sorting domain-containing protein n=1 Tax=Membranihabitans marinus TaxID=1227546 RepID=UPI001F218A12|nr:T9SS type A sorting domain-containing protein [Membranihabitans marinus]